MPTGGTANVRPCRQSCCRILLCSYLGIHQIHSTPMFLLVTIATVQQPRVLFLSCHSSEGQPFGSFSLQLPAALKGVPCSDLRPGREVFY